MIHVYNHCDSDVMTMVLVLSVLMMMVSVMMVLTRIIAVTRC